MNELNQNLQNEIKILENRLNEDKQLLENEANEDMKTLIQDEIKEIEGQIQGLQNSIDASNGNYETASDDGEEPLINFNEAILEIRSGTGGDEAGLFAFDLYRMYMRYGERVNWKTEELFFSENTAGGIKTATIGIRGKNVYNLLKNESGVHRVQRVPVTEAGGRIHTSTATVAVLPEMKKVDIEIKPDDLKWEFFRSGGKYTDKLLTTMKIII